MHGILCFNTLSHGKPILLMKGESFVSTRKWKALLKAVQMGSLSKAANTLGYTQSGITHMMNSLETEVGFPLLQRNWDGVHLTAVGEELLPDIQRLIDADERLQKHLENVNTSEEEHLNIGTYASISIQWLPSVLSALYWEAPRLTIELHVGWHGLMGEWLENGSTDLLLGEKYERPDFSWTPLYNDPLVAILPENHPAAGNAAFSSEDLDGFPLLYESGCLLAQKIIKAYGSSNKHLNIRSEDESVVISMVRQGIGCGILPELCIRGRADKLAVLPLKTPIDRSLGISRRKGRPESLAEQQLMAQLVAHVQQQTTVYRS